MKNILLALSFGLFFNLSGSHIIATQFDYQYLATLSNGNRQYMLKFVMTRDCSPGAIEFGSELDIGIYDVNTSDLFKASKIKLTNTVTLTSCYGSCIQEGIYEVLIELPSNISGYYAMYQICCRNETKNIRVGQNGEPDKGIMAYCLIPGNMPNSFAFFSYDKYKLVEPTISDTGNFFTYDADGDSVVVEITPSIEGPSINTNYPNIPSKFNGPKIMDNSAYNTGYSYSLPLGLTSVFSCDNVKKQIIVKCDSEGLYTVAYAIKEYRKGILIATTIRETEIHISNTPKPGSPLIRLDGSGNLKPEVRLEWSLHCADDAVKQYIERSVNNNSGFVRIDSVDGRARAYVDQNITLKTAYFYRVVPVRNEGMILGYSNNYQVTLWSLGLRQVMSANSNLFSVSPVPVENSFRISLPEGFIKSYMVTDHTGRIINNKEIPDGINSCELDCSKWPAGFYLIQCTTDNGDIMFKKIVKA